MGRWMIPHKILYVHHRPELGGAPVSLAGLISSLDRSRFEPYVYCPPGPASQLFSRAGAQVINGPTAMFTHIWASHYTGLRWLLFGRELSHLPRAYQHFSRLLRERDFDLVHLNDSPLVYFALISRSLGLPTIWHLRSALAHGGNDVRGRLISAAIDRTGSHVIAIDGDVAQSYRGKRPVHIVYNSVDLEQFEPKPSGPAKRAIGIPDDAPAIGLFGYLYARKGWPDFLRAAKHMLAAGVDARFVIVGGGVRPKDFFATTQGRMLSTLGLASDEEARARASAEALGLHERIHFLPFTPDPRDAYWALDIVTFPNRGEGLGRAVIEASACGRPIVASGSASGAGLLVPEETGYLVPRRSADALAAALTLLVGDEALRLRLGGRARRHAEENFDGRRNAARVMELYEEALRD